MLLIIHLSICTILSFIVFTVYAANWNRPTIIVLNTVQQCFSATVRQVNAVTITILYVEMYGNTCSQRPIMDVSTIFKDYIKTISKQLNKDWVLSFTLEAHLEGMWMFEQLTAVLRQDSSLTFRLQDNCLLFWLRKDTTDWSVITISTINMSDTFSTWHFI